MNIKRAISGGLVATATVIGLTGCASMNQQTFDNCTVQAKERLIQEGSSAQKRVITTCGVFAVDDSFEGGFNSYDTWAKLTEGKAYKIKSGGYRIGFLSEFPTVLEATEVRHG